MKFRSLICGLAAILLLSCFQGCSGCSRSGREASRRDKQFETSKTITKPRDFKKKASHGTEVEMIIEGGVYMIPVIVNGVGMKFVFDTGASLISISATEAMFLHKQGTLTDDDFLGTANFVDANGDVTEGTIINLKTVQIGSVTMYNIEASVVHNLQAPLLFGQSALSQFGKISIDNENNILSFE
jgi:aspartyl protease family protein